MNDDQIVELYLKRSEDAIAETKTKYGAGLREIAYRILNDRETAEECEYDAYYKTWSMIPPHEPRTYLFAFIGKINFWICRSVSAPPWDREGNYPL